ncbi:MAG TPA: hypothetical protein VK886_04515 [Vicinamibacterales bacterium]|nr:hypothetical protein [Vicinamibacterales bacterium]
MRHGPAPRLGSQHRAGPRAEVLAGEGLARDLPQVPVHVVRLDIPTLAVLVHVPEHLQPRQLATPFCDRRQPAIADADRVLDPALAT